MIRIGTSVRIVLGLVAFLSTLLLPVWIALICMTLLSLRWRAWEVLFLGVWIDFLWLPTGFFSPFPIYTAVALALIIVFEPLRREILFT